MLQYSGYGVGVAAGEILDEIRGDKVSLAVIKFITSKDDRGAHLNEIARELNTGSRVTILDRLNNLEDKGVLESRMELTKYGEEHVQKWTRKYRISNKYKEPLKHILHS